MPDDLEKKRPQDSSRINLSQQWEIDYWCKELKCSESELRRAVAKAGPMVIDVRRELSRYWGIGL